MRSWIRLLSWYRQPPISDANESLQSSLSVYGRWLGVPCAMKGMARFVCFASTTIVAFIMLIMMFNFLLCYQCHCYFHIVLMWIIINLLKMVRRLRAEASWFQYIEPLHCFGSFAQNMQYHTYKTLYFIQSILIGVMSDIMETIIFSIYRNRQKREHCFSKDKQKYLKCK